MQNHFCEGIQSGRAYGSPVDQKDSAHVLRQLGGGEARVGLVCCHYKPDSLRSELEVAVRNQKIAVFEQRDLVSLEAGSSVMSRLRAMAKRRRVVTTSIGQLISERCKFLLTAVGSLWDKGCRHIDQDLLQLGSDPQNPPVDYWGLGLALSKGSGSALFTGRVRSE